MNLEPSAIAGAANKVAYGGGATAVIGGWSANEFAAIGGLVIALIGLLVQVYYKRKADKREMQEHNARMAVLQRGEDDGG